MLVSIFLVSIKESHHSGDTSLYITKSPKSILSKASLITKGL
jgi:hypothetical protein